jgi:hypothetical protein
METEQNPLKKNMSRLVKLAWDSDKPSDAFTNSLIDVALHKLNEPEMKVTQRGPFLSGNIDKMMSVAAMIAILCGAVFEILISNLVWMNTLFAATVFVTMFTNGLSYIGGLIL